MLATAEPDKPLTRTIKAEDEDDTQVFWHAEHVQVAVISLLTSAFSRRIIQKFMLGVSLGVLSMGTPVHTITNDAFQHAK